jgi:hypothetical protein
VSPNPKLDNAHQRQWAFHSVGLESSGNDTASSFPFEPSTFRRILFTLTNIFTFQSPCRDNKTTQQPANVSRQKTHRQIEYQRCRGFFSPLAPLDRMDYRDAHLSIRSAPGALPLFAMVNNAHTSYERIQFQLTWRGSRGGPQTILLASIHGVVCVILGRKGCAIV